jgi:hypothetical protein
VEGPSVALQPRDAVNQGKWAVEHQRQGLIHEVVDARRKSNQPLKRFLGITEPAPQERIFRVNFAEMQRIKLRKLQVKLGMMRSICSCRIGNPVSGKPIWPSTVSIVAEVAVYRRM